jgi:rRNA maturation endonuclease Nob1
MKQCASCGARVKEVYDLCPRCGDPTNTKPTKTAKEDTCTTR